jgi:hypothetical protein
MSATIQLSAKRPRPWVLVWLGGALVPMALGLAVLETLSLVLPPLPHRPAPANPELQLLATATPAIAEIALPTALLLVAIMAFAERASVQSFSRWMAAGFVASTPATLYLARVTDSLDILVYCFGLLGTAVAYFIRHGGRTA